MKAVVLINAAGDLSRRQTTAMLIHAGAQRGHEVFVAGVGDLVVSEGGQVRARARTAPDAATVEEAVAVLRTRESDAGEIVVSDCDLALLRTNPGRDSGNAALHEAALGFARLLRDRGVRVVNDPDGLTRAGSKLYLSGLPSQHVPVTRVSHHPAELMAFVRERDISVLKPLTGTRGQDVFRVTGDDPNLRQIAEVVTAGGFGLAQEFVPEAVEGDTRVVLWNGRVLECGGQIAAVRRRPGDGDFRSNIHAGGHPEEATLTPVIEEVVAAIGPQIAADGVLLAGLDLIGSKVVEVNVFSTGGLYDAERFTGASFTDELWSRLEDLRASEP